MHNHLQVFIISVILATSTTHAVTTDVGHFHAPQYDNNGKLISWHIDADGPFHYIMDLQAKWWLKAPIVSGWPAYLTAAELDRNYRQRNGAVPGSTCSMAILAYLKYYAYTGNVDYRNLATTAGNYVLHQCLTPVTCKAYPGFPWPVGKTGDIHPDGSGHPNCRAGEIMPDKGAMIGFALLRLYEATGEQAYLEEVIHIANVLADNATEGSASQSPWPFRCLANEGTMVDGKISGNQSFALRLYDELLRIGETGNGKYQATRNNVWNWLKNVVIADDTGSKWQGFFEDHSGNEDNPTQICALETARYLLEKKDSLDPDWFNKVGHIVKTVKDKWTVHSGNYMAIGEQTKDMTPYNSHTARFASILAMYYKAGAGKSYKDEAYSSFCYAAYSVDKDGFADTYYGSNIAWTSDSFGDWMLHFIDGLAAIPEWAPDKSSHLLASTSVIKNISYDTGKIEYVTFDNSGTEKLKLCFMPVAVNINDKPITSWVWNGDAHILQIDRTTGNKIQILSYK